MKIFISAAVFYIVFSTHVSGGIFRPYRLACADGQAVAPQGQQDGRLSPTKRQYNDRLPPVLPGEEVVTDTGQRMRVWSSAGPVPINPTPQPQQLPGGGIGGGIGIIVDDRGHGIKEKSVAGYDQRREAMPLGRENTKRH